MRDFMHAETSGKVEARRPLLTDGPRTLVSARAGRLRLRVKSGAHQGQVAQVVPSAYRMKVAQYVSRYSFCTVRSNAS